MTPLEVAPSGAEPRAHPKKSEMTTRLASAVVMGALALGSVLVSVWTFVALAIAAGVTVAWEWGRLVRRAGFDAIAGVRQFHWSRRCRTERWGAAPVEIIDRTSHHDLARSHAFRAPGTLPAAEVPARMAGLARELSKHWRLAPGRIAQGYLEAGRATRPSGAARSTL